MSKAFTDEESADASVAGRVPERARPGEERPITREGHRRLVEEHTRLLQTELPEAKAQGLLGEAKVRELTHRIALLEATLASVQIVERVPGEQIRFGARVTLEWEDGRTQQLELVGPDEAEPREGRISVESPLARSLLGREAGDTVEVRRPKGTEEATVVAVE